MPTFGSHEAGERIFLSGVGGIYALKEDSSKVVKVLQPPEAVWSDERLQEEIDAFRLRAKTQRAIAKVSKYWAPVYEVSAIRQGTEALSGGGEILSHPSSIGDPNAMRPVASGAFFTMDRYERSLQSLIDGQVNVLNADLRCLVTALMKGLLDLAKNENGVGGRPHGALTSSNVLLKNSADLTTATVHLTDPAPDGALDKNSHNADLGNIARIIYELVNHRPYEEGTIARSRDWDALGPNGEDWRELCITLLDPQAPAEERNLEKLLPKIDTWRRKPKKSKKPALAVAAAVLVIVGSFYIYHVTHPKVVYDAGRWEALNLEYHAWFGDFIHPLYDPKNLTQIHNQIPSLGTVLDNYKDFYRYDPEQIDGNAKEWTDRINVPNGDNPLARYGDNPAYTQKGLNFIDEVGKALSAERWNAIGALGTRATQFEARGWQKPAAGIRARMEEARPPKVLNPEKPVEDAVKEYSKTPLAERIKKADEIRKEHAKSVFDAVSTIVAINRTSATINSHYESVQKDAEALPGTKGDGAAGQIPLLAGLKKFIDAHTAAAATEDVASLEPPLAELDGVMGQLKAAFPANRQVDFEELLADAAAKQTPSIDSYKAFVKATENYWNIPRDPRDPTNWAKKLAEINEMIGIIKDSAAPDDKDLPGINTQFKSLSDTVSATEALKPIMKNEKLIADGTSSIAQRLEGLFDSANNHPAYMNEAKFADFVSRQKAKSDDSQKLPPAIAAVSGPVKEKWLEAQKAFTATVGKRTLAEFRKTHVADEKKFAELEAFYADLDKTIPTDDAARANLEKAFAAGPDWANALAHRVAAESRVQVLADLLKNAVKDAANPPPQNDATYVSLRQKTRTTYDQDICIKTQQLINDHLTMDARLNTLHIDKADGWRKLWEMWPENSNALLAETPIKSIRTRVAALLTAESQSDYAKIREASQSDNAEISLASWRLLGTAQIAEPTPYLADEQAAEKKLAVHLDKLKSADAAQAQAINDEIAKALPVRWQRWSDLALTADAIKLALDQAKTFKVDITKQSQPVMYYYDQLIKLKEDAKAHPKEAELKPIAQAFSDLLTKDPALTGIAKDPTVAQLLELMRKSMSEEQNMSAAGQGPQLAGWDMEQPNQDIRIFRSKDKKFTLEFRRLQVDENSLADKPQKTIFLCTTEMPVNIFIQAMNANGKLDELNNSKAAAAHWFEVPATNYYTLGPRSWAIVGDQFTLSTKWLDEAGDPLTKDKPFYPAAANPGDPFADAPVELISPWAAMYAARLLGCRLPTSDEWQTAYATFEVPKPGGPALPKDIWNLRGENAGGKASWATQQAFADAYDKNLLPFPDGGIYSNLSKPAPKGASAKPWMTAELAKIAPERITPGTGVYTHNSLWFEPVGKEAIAAGGAGTPIMHHLVGNVAEFVFDTPDIMVPIPNNVASTNEIDDAVRKPTALNKMFVIGGSSLSPPEIPFNEKQPVSATSVPAKRGYSDVGFRLAYTAPKETIVEVLAKAFKDPKVLPGPRKPAG